MAPDSFILLVQNVGSRKKIDALLIIEHLDLVGLNNAYYSLQKQYDGKSIIERGGSLIEFVESKIEMVWMLDFPIPMSLRRYTFNKRNYFVPDLIGRMPEDHFVCSFATENYSC